jgi:hypothetical protein
MEQRVTNMKKVAVVIGSICIASIILFAQTAGTPKQLRVKTDANGYLAMTAGSLTLPLSQPTQFDNIRLLTDSNGYLLTAVVNTNSTFTGDVQANCSTVTYDFTGRLTTGLNSNAANTWSLCGGATLGLSGNTSTVTASLPVNFTGDISLNGVLLISHTNPTIGSGFCTSPSIVHATGTASFTIQVGTTCSGINSGTIALPTAPNGWSCSWIDIDASDIVEQSASTVSSVTLTHFSMTTGNPLAFTDSDNIAGHCLAY